MILLVDTHILIWALLDDPSLRKVARDLITNPKNTVCVSTVSFVEVAIKRSLGRDSLVCSAQDLISYVEQCGIQTVSLVPAHAVTLETLPWHHRDPFDRMLVAQALTESMRLVTHDHTLTMYSDTVIEV